MQFVAGPCVLSDEDVDSFKAQQPAAWKTFNDRRKDIDQTDLHRF